MSETSNKTRLEHDCIGQMEVPANVYWGIHTQRAIGNFPVSGITDSQHPELIRAYATVKRACAIANEELGLIDPAKAEAIRAACLEIEAGKLADQFPVDVMQGGAGTSSNMNMNEVIANRALEIAGRQRGDYTYIHPNDDVNKSQSTNDTYPAACKLALIDAIGPLAESTKKLAKAFHDLADKHINDVTIGRTQLQDAVPMTLGQEFEAYAATLTEEIDRLKTNMRLFYEINMGATAIGTGINADPDYAELCTKHLREITGLPLTKAANMIEATSDTGAFIMNSSALKRLAVKLSKICNDLRLLSSGPRCGLNEINLPPRQPGSSIMPGKVNPVIPEVVNQVAFRVIGNDLAITLASEAGQLELNVMEPIIVLSLFENIEMLVNAMNTLREKCIVGITANPEVCRRMVYNSIGLVTALNPYLGYETSTMLAKEALQSGKGIYDLVLEHKLMDDEELNKILRPENMVHPRKKITE